MRHFPTWSAVKAAMDDIARRTTFDLSRNSSYVFDQFGYIKNYCTDEKINEWQKRNVATEDHWVEIFKHLERAQLPFREFALIIEFILCLPGSSAPVERIFSIGKQMWKTESSALHVKTLNAMLKVKCNMELNCLDFYTFLKGQPALLRKISTQEKYGFSKGSDDTGEPSVLGSNDEAGPSELASGSSPCAMSFEIGSE